MFANEKVFFLITFSGPSAPPQDLQLKDTTSSSLLVGWNEVPAADKNGIIISYTVNYQSISSLLVENLTVYFPTREVNLTGLIRDMNYSVRVLASTGKGDGNYSDPDFFVTNQDGKLVFRFPSNNPPNMNPTMAKRGHNLNVLRKVEIIFFYLIYVFHTGRKHHFFTPRRANSAICELSKDRFILVFTLNEF